MTGPFIAPTEAAGRALFSRGLEGPVVMLNLLRLRDIADYAADPQLAPAAPISGAEAFDRYIAHTRPHLEALGGELLFVAEGGPFLIGPAEERWDVAMLVRQSSLQAFMGMASNAAYLAGRGHRTAAVADSRLLPLVERVGTVEAVDSLAPANRFSGRRSTDGSAAPRN